MLTIDFYLIKSKFEFLINQFIRIRAQKNLNEINNLAKEEPKKREN